MKRKIMIAYFVIIAQFSFGQQFTDLYGDYLGQTPPGDTHSRQAKVCKLMKLN